MCYLHRNGLDRFAVWLAGAAGAVFDVTDGVNAPLTCPRPRLFPRLLAPLLLLITAYISNRSRLISHPLQTHIQHPLLLTGVRS